MTGTPDAAPGATASERSGGSALLAVAVLVALQGALLLGLAVFSLIELLISTPKTMAGAVGLVALAALGGVGLLLVARALRAGRRWARAPALVTQLIFLPVALGSFPDGWYVGAPMLVWAVAVTVLLFLPSVSALLDE